MGVYNTVILHRQSVPLIIVHYRPHEIIRHTNTVIRILEKHRRIGRSGKRTIISSIDQGPSLLLFIDLTVNEINNVWVGYIQHYHLCSAASFPS